MLSIRRISILLLTLVLCLSAAVSCSKQEEGAPNGMKTLSNELVDYNLYIPTGWIEDSSTRFISAYVSDTDRSNISVEAFELESSDMTLDSFWEGYEADFEATFSDMEYETKETMLLGGAAANKYVYTATVTDAQYKFMQVTCIKGATVYIFTYTAQPNLYDEHIQAVEAILSYFSFK